MSLERCNGLNNCSNKDGYKAKIIIENTGQFRNSCCIGVTRPTGPTGSIGHQELPRMGIIDDVIVSTGVSELAVYSGKYNDTQQTVNLGIGTQVEIPLPINMQNLNVTCIPTNSITVDQTGTYEIKYNSNIEELMQLYL